MPRSTKSGKARQLNAAHRLLQRNVALPEAVQRLSRQFNLSERQAYRYLGEAAQLDRPVEVTEASVPITLKVPPSTARLLRAYARSSGLTIVQLGIEQADAEAARTVRLEHGKPRYGEDITDRFLAQETNQSHALHFSKGCYLGQEIVERVRARAQLHRKLMPLDIDGNTAPTPGTSLTTRGNATAEITSAAFSPALAKVVALAYVRTA